MTQEEKQLLLIDLCGRIPYHVIIHCIDNDTDYNCFLTTDILHEIQNGYEYYDYKPYLRSMSSMSEKEINEFILISDTVLRLGNKRSTCILSLEQMDWFNKKMFDYRGLISMGLALEAKEEMYKTK